jgi:thymidine kinase
MSKVYFRYGTVESSKSLQLLAVAHNYEKQGKRVMCFKPALDDRTEDIYTRAGFSRQADVVLDKGDTDVVSHVSRFGYFDLDCVLVDEAQFLTREQVIAFTDVADKIGVPVIAYGLLTDFLGNQFEGSKAWVEYAESIEEIKTVCYYCNTKAIMNLRLLGNLPVFDGDVVETGDTTEEEGKLSYKPVCRKCFKMAKRGVIQLRKGKQKLK